MENRKHPHPMTLKRIVDVLHFPYTFFFEKDPQRSLETYFAHCISKVRRKILFHSKVKAKACQNPSLIGHKVRFIACLPDPAEPQISLEECYALFSIGSLVIKYMEENKAYFSRVPFIVECVRPKQAQKAA